MALALPDNGDPDGRMLSRRASALVRRHRVVVKHLLCFLHKGGLGGAAQWAVLALADS